jgi:hypothetical protein
LRLGQPRAGDEHRDERGAGGEHGQRAGQSSTAKLRQPTGRNSRQPHAAEAVRTNSTPTGPRRACARAHDPSGSRRTALEAAASLRARAVRR